MPSLVADARMENPPMMVISTSSTRVAALRFLLGLLNTSLFPWLVFVLLLVPLDLQSLHRRRSRLCSQMLAPPQSLHLLRWRLCWQMLAPLQSLHVVRRRLCGQMPLPPQSLHRLCSPL